MQQVCDAWADMAQRRAEMYGAALRALGTDPGILALGIELLRTLTRSATRQVVVHCDFNPGNLLAARRARYLAIDPKPMVGDPAYDPWSLVAQLDWPFRAADAANVVPQRIRQLAELFDLSPERIAAWGVARDVDGGLACGRRRRGMLRSVRSGFGRRRSWRRCWDDANRHAPANRGLADTGQTWDGSEQAVAL